MRAARLAVTVLAVAGAFIGVAPASASHRCVAVAGRPPVCPLPHYCVMDPDGTIRCYG